MCSVTPTTTCRICWRKSGNLKSLFAEESARNYSVMFESLTSKKLEICDRTPSHICSDCERSLITSYNFQRQCIQSIENVEVYLDNLQEAERDTKENLCPDVDISETEMMGMNPIPCMVEMFDTGDDLDHSANDLTELKSICFSWSSSPQKFKKGCDAVLEDRRQLQGELENSTENLECDIMTPAFTDDWNAEDQSWKEKENVCPTSTVGRTNRFYSRGKNRIQEYGNHSNEILRHVSTCTYDGEVHADRNENDSARPQTRLSSKTSENFNQKVLDSLPTNNETFTIKNDPLICLYGENLFTKRPDLTPSLISDKLREAARFLVVLKSLRSEIKGLFDALKPELFQDLIVGAKMISGLDYYKTDSLESPSLAINFGTDLKSMCDVAIRIVSEERRIPNIRWSDNDDKETELRELREMISNRWFSEMSRLLLAVLEQGKLENSLLVAQEYDDGTDDDLSKNKKRTVEKKPKVGSSCQSGEGNLSSGRRHWTQSEKRLVKERFKEHIKKKIVPRKKECEIFRLEHSDVLKDKDWVRIKTFVYNTFKKSTWK